MPDEVAKLAEKLGEVMIESPWQGGICGPTEYVTLRSVLVCAADNDMGQLEALARVALDWVKERGYINLNVGEHDVDKFYPEEPK